MPKKPKLIRKLRHWKQRFHKNAAFIWRRQLLFQGNLTEPGMPIPEILAENPTKLRRFWESKVIELAEFDAPNVATGMVDDKKVVYQEGQHVPVEGLPADVMIHKAKGSWFAITQGMNLRKVNGQKNLDAAVEELIEEAKTAAEAVAAQTDDSDGKSDNLGADNGSDGGDTDAA